MIDQSVLPHRFETRRIDSAAAAEQAIRTMVVRGAPLIGVTGAYGLALALRSDPSDAALAAAHAQLLAARPTAVNLRWALDRIRAHVAGLPPERRAAAAWDEAHRMAEEDVELNRAIGHHGAELLRALHQRLRRPVNVLTHCNTGWLAAVDHGTALSAVYTAHDSGVPVHVWVDETRPRNQGLLTVWELGAHGVPHALIVDNAGGHLMQRGQVDVVIVGADRVSAQGDVANKIGTYLKALAARDCGIPFYAAVPSPTIDWRIGDGLSSVPIEERARERGAASDRPRRERRAGPGPADAGFNAGRQSGVRRHAGTFGHRHHYRARRCGARTAGRTLSGASAGSGMTARFKRTAANACTARHSLVDVGPSR